MHKGYLPREWPPFSAMNFRSGRPERQPDASWQFRRVALTLKTDQARSGVPDFYARLGARSGARAHFSFCRGTYLPKFKVSTPHSRPRTSAKPHSWLCPFCSDLDLLVLFQVKLSRKFCVSFIYQFIYLFIYLFIHSFIHLFIYLFISIFFRQGTPFSFATVPPRGPAHMNTNNNVTSQMKIYNVT